LRFGVVYEPCANAYYRAIDPMRAMARRGHEIVWPDQQGRLDLRRLGTCDVVHMYRTGADDPLALVRTLKKMGVPTIYDNDDDFTSVPKESPDYQRYGGLAGQRIFATTVACAKLSCGFTTTNDILAAKYEKAGVERVHVIQNQLATDIRRPRVAHDGIVIGWVAGVDHRADTDRIPVVDALRQTLDRYPKVNVATVGLKLRLSQRYRHHPSVGFLDLPAHIGGYDIGIAPLADLPGNRARSDIKVKEYAASAVPWLASPVGPYAGLGPAQGGRLVADGDWPRALSELINQRLRRWWLARRGVAWALANTIDSVADQWEGVFTAAARK
jgi:hypothetical protein